MRISSLCFARMYDKPIKHAMDGENTHPNAHPITMDMPILGSTFISKLMASCVVV